MLAFEQLVRLPAGDRVVFHQRFSNCIGVFQTNPLLFEILMQLRHLVLGNKTAPLQFVKKYVGKLG